MLHQLYGGLTIIQSASALTFSVFYVTHATQFMAAPFGGIELSNKYLLLGRPLYQDEHLEPILVTGAATMHVLSGVAKGAIRTYWRRNSKTSQPLSLHRTAGYILLPLATLHYTVTRALPQEHFGDSAFLDYSYIAFLLQKYPAITYIGHAALVCTMSYHMIGGMNIAINQVFRRRKSQDHSITAPSKRSQLYASLAVTTLAVCGLYVIGKTEKIPLRREYARIVQKLAF